MKRMVTSLMKLGYVNNYDKNRYLEKFPKAAVYIYGSKVCELIQINAATSYICTHIPVNIDSKCVYIDSKCVPVFAHADEGSRLLPVSSRP